jgi:YihY family inner membrane protein
MNVIEKPLGAADRFQQRHVVLAFPVAVWSKFNDDQAGNLAALISYYAFAAIFPLLLVLVTVLNIVLKSNPKLQQTLIESAVSQYPVIGPQIKGNLGTIPGTGLPLIIGAVLLLFGARGVAGAMQNALCSVWDIKREDRPGFPMSQVWAFALIFTVGLGFILTTFLAGVAGGIGHVINGTVVHVGTVLISLVLNVGVFWLSFRIATARMVPWRNLRIGAAIAAVCWTVLQLVGSYVIGHQLQRASELYGTFGIVLGLVAWLFLQAEVTLYAAEVDVVLTRRLWPASILPPKKDEPAKEGEPATEGKAVTEGEPAKKDEAPEEGEPAKDGETVRESEPAKRDEPAKESRGRHARPDDGASLEEEPGRDGRADADGQAPVPPPRGEPSASDKKAGSAR